MYACSRPRTTTAPVPAWWARAWACSDPVETFGPATVFDANLLDGTTPLACVLIDEAQFLQPEQVRQLHRLAHTRRLPVICYGLRSDFRGEAFPGAAALLTLADDLEEMKTICACARKASMNLRIDAQGPARGRKASRS